MNQTPEDLQQLREDIAPCGLDCRRCLARQGGDIQRLSDELRDRLGNFATYAERFSGMNPVFTGYPQFAVLLEHLAGAACGGCRTGGCLLSTCRVHPCVKARGVDYCHECPEFPCADHGLPPQLAERWKTNNEKMREMGLAAYAALVMSRPRY